MRYPDMGYLAGTISSQTPATDNPPHSLPFAVWYAFDRSRIACESPSAAQDQDRVSRAGNRDLGFGDTGHSSLLSVRGGKVFPSSSYNMSK